MEPTNREQRRHPERLEDGEEPGHENPKTLPETDINSPARTPDEQSVRAKSTGHGKKTADKWNQ